MAAAREESEAGAATRIGEPEISRSGLVVPPEVLASPKAAPGKARSVFTLEDVAAHATADDCWIVAHGIVYDVTEYIALHPGGAKAIIRHAGKVCDEDFDFHSPAAQRQVWSKYAIGKIKGTTCAVM